MRDNKGRFTKKNEEEMKLTFFLPTMKTVFFWIFFISILMPWLLIIARMDLFPKLLIKFEELIFPENGKCERNGDAEKKSGLFY